MITVSFNEMADVLETTLPENPAFSYASPFPPVSIDTRTLDPGDCFVAIQGSRFDGHDFIDEALARGARVVVHSQPLPAGQPSDALFLSVGDTTLALRQLARCVREKWAGSVVAVTGSMGKTTTRRFCSTLLRQRFQVRESPGNLNNHLGLPLSLLLLQDDDEVAVVELGMNHPGEIRKLSLICQPDVAVITNVAPVHLEFFQSLDHIAQAKAEILEGLKAGGALLFNGEDERLCSIAARFDGSSLDFGAEGDRRVRVAARTRTHPEGMEIAVQTPTAHFQTRVPLSGRHYLYNIAAAVAVAVTLGLSDAEIEQGVSHLAVAEQRGQVRSLNPASGVGLTLVDESYNSNPAALRTVLEDFAGWAWPGRKVAVLGDMLELGDAAARFHHETGRYLAGLEIDLVVAVGELAAEILEGAVAAGMASHQLFSTPDSSAAAALLSGLVQDGDLVLVKASRGVGLDRMIQILEPGESSGEAGERVC